MNAYDKLPQVVNRLAREGLTVTPDAQRVPPRSSRAWAALRSAGTRLWLDTGDLEEAAALWCAEYEALTTNNTLLNKEVQKGIYDGLVARAAAEIRQAAPGIDEQRLRLELAFLLNARHGLRLVDRFGVFVSVELHTDLAHDVERTVEYGRRFHAVCPERFYVKVPLSPAGILGARRLSDAGIPVNLTLGFSARQNVLAACLARPAYVNVFMGRLNAFVADHKLGDGRHVGEKATLSTQRELMALRKARVTNALLIGASMRDGTQVGALAGLDVYTMPPKVAAQYEAAPLASVTSRVADDPAVTFSPGVLPGALAADTLWTVTPAFKACVNALLQKDPARLGPEDVVTHLEAAGFGDVFPRWSEADTRAAAADGKIPVYARWKERLASGKIGLDALMNLSAFHAFVADQAALDARVVSLLR